mmetsp:Transcript_145826/g.206606  ORF Transcript_145826/g.206606 Transcript_145826/m.206606 type:complete len:239 (-) Transcript_145826:99-815(-)
MKQSSFSKPANKVCPEQELSIPKDLVMTQVLSDAKFQVFQGYSAAQDYYYAVKVFPTEGKNNQVHHLYKNEKRFAALNHKNLITPLFTVDEQKVIQVGGAEKKTSIILMEYASKATLFDMLVKESVPMTETIARTMFHQLINGLEYLHKSGVAHLDLKLENILFSGDYTLKIADFDLSYCENDSKCVSKGTTDYRAPELNQCRTFDQYKKCDIYSAGMLLFCMMNEGLLPYKEYSEEA